jgi:hypothetical protein
MSREAFEKWALAEGFNIDRDPDVPKYSDYHRATTRWAWIAWQEAIRQSVAYVRARAEEQEQTNHQYPEHAKAYPPWESRVTQFRFLADDMEKALSAIAAASPQ